MKRDFLNVDMKKNKKILVGGLLLLLVVVFFARGGNTEGEKTKVSESQLVMEPKKQEIRSERSSESTPVSVTYQVKRATVATSGEKPSE